ncbi:MAG: beta-galactosidase [Ruminococcaceae bacterium]|nr:beta-galactosidase [Oscillospiraceae bacterium]
MLEIKNSDFYLDGKTFHIYSGAVHYFRFFPEYWEDTLKKLKACGFNTVETYVSWNLHEKEEGEFDFTGNLDIVRFLKTAQRLGLYAIVRPGPYICAEWSFGGLPAWLLKDKGMQVRSMYKPYLDAVSGFYRALFREIAPMQLSNGGNIIAMQIENEYGSYGNDKNYLRFIKELMESCGCTELLFTSDGAEDNMLSGGTLPEVFKVANFGSRTEEAFRTLRKYQPDGPLMCGEFWNGWFDAWGEDEIHHHRSAETVVTELKKMLGMNASFSFYTFHGGTNFGFNSGANCYERFQPTVTSYDDDALLNEWGGYTEKYHAVREVLLAHQGNEPDELPPEPELQNIGEVKLTSFAALMKNLDGLSIKVKSFTAEGMEQFGLNDGLILYRTKISGKYDGKLFLDGLSDRAHVFIDGKLKAVIYRNDPEHSTDIGLLEGEHEIAVLVEDMGRINYGPYMHNRKGVSGIRIKLQYLSDFDIYPMPLDDLSALEFGCEKSEYPLFMRGYFKAEKNKGCFVHPDGFTKGYIFVNGFNLGRYWNVGPQKSLYIPGVLLKEDNEITVLELDGSETDTLTITDIHDIG